MGLVREDLVTRISSLRTQMFGLAELTAHQGVDPLMCTLMDAIQRVNYELGTLEEMLRPSRSTGQRA